MNRELRRLQEIEEKRAKERRAAAMGQRRRKERKKFREFVSEVRTELRRVAWPNRREVVTFTLVTLITAGAVTLYTFGLDLSLKPAVLRFLELR
jgi:preprotein translocase subunit SecE